MKDLKFISLMMGCLAAVCVAFTSCSDDDDNNNGLSPQERQSALTAVRGEYTGRLIYAATNKDNANDRADTVTVGWSIQSDSVMTIRNFPLSVLGKASTDSAFIKAMDAAGTQTITCAIGFINLSPVTFLINPTAVTLNLTYGGASHKVQIPFYGNTYYSFGQQSTVDSKSVLQMQIVEGAIYVDDQNTGWINNSQAVPFIFISDSRI